MRSAEGEGYESEGEDFSVSVKFRAGADRQRQKPGNGFWFSGGTARAGPEQCEQRLK